MGNCGIILRRRRKSRDQRGFFLRHSFCRFAEIVFGSCFVTVRTVAQKYLIGVQGENLGFGEAALDLNGEQRLLNFAIERAGGRKKKIAGKLHGESGCALDFSTRLDIAIRGARNAPDVDARVAVEILVFNRDQGVAQNLGIIIVTGDDPALQRKGTDYSSASVKKFSDRAGTIAFELIDLRQVSGVDEKKSSSGAHRGGEQHEQPKQEVANQLPFAGFKLRRILKDEFQRACFKASEFQGFNVKPWAKFHG